MLKFIASLTLVAVVLTSWGFEEKDIPYYEADAPKTGDVKYLAERCTLNVLTPDNVKNFPTLIWFHGGGIAQGNKHYVNVNKKQIAIVAVNYRLSGKGANCPDYLFDSAAAVAWTIKNIAKYGGDPKQIYVSGHSAGGYLTAMVALDPQYLAAFGCKPSDVKRYMPVSGQMTTHFQVLNERRKKDPSTPHIVLDKYAPISLASKATPPMTLIVGDSDVEWPARVEENQLLAARLKRNFHHKDIKCYSFETFNHGTVMAPAMAVINNKILADNKALKPKKEK